MNFMDFIRNYGGGRSDTAIAEKRVAEAQNQHDTNNALTGGRDAAALREAAIARELGRMRTEDGGGVVNLPEETVSPYSLDPAALLRNEPQLDAGATAVPDEINYNLDPEALARAEALLDPAADTGGAKTRDADAGSYKIQRGDTLGAIAKKHGTTIDELMKLNDNIYDGGDLIYAGESLVLPGSDEAALREIF